MAAAVAGGVTSLVCPPDTDPVLDEPGLVEMLKFRARTSNLARVYPLGALTRGLEGEVLTEMAELTEAGCVGFAQAEVPLARHAGAAARAAVRGDLRLHRLAAPATTPGSATASPPSGALATRLGLSGVPVVAETIALRTIFELVRDTGARVHLCRLSSAAGVELVRQAKAEGLPVTCDVEHHHAAPDRHRHRLLRRRHAPRCRRCASSATATRSAPALADGTIDALCRDHTPVDEDAKHLPFAEAEPGATGLELLLRAGAASGARRASCRWRRRSRP